jgi:hypothetical protein
MPNDTPEGEVIFEFLRIGNSVRVSAVHVATDTEITLVGAPSVGEYGLKLAALRKLNYVLAQKRNGA